MKKPQFVPGDVVTLKSDATVPMTVESVASKVDRKWETHPVVYQCVWFDVDEKPHREEFPECVLAMKKISLLEKEEEGEKK